jgi:DMSO/TMAO reductase YedYZ heme-binding membrane subunit
MKISSDDKKAISLILICLGFLCFVIGIAAHLKAGFQSRAEITTTGFVAAAIFAVLGILVFLFSITKKQN